MEINSTSLKENSLDFNELLKKKSSSSKDVLNILKKQSTQINESNAKTMS